jgi:Xaa-Pro aminopeptidase
MSKSRLQRDREAKARKLLESSDLEALVVTAWDNVRLLTGSAGYLTVDWYVDAGAAILARDQEPAMIGGLEGKIADGVRVLGEWKSYPFADSAIIPDLWAGAIAKALKESHVSKGRVGFDYLPESNLVYLRDRFPRIEFVCVLLELLKARAVKTSDEIGLIRDVALIIDIGMQRGLESLRAGISEREVYAEISGAMIKAGSEMTPWTPCCTSSGEYADLKPTDYRLKLGDSIRWDVGAYYRGYVGDASRTGTVGYQEPSFGMLYAQVHEAHMNGIEAIRPGNLASEVDHAVRKTLRRYGLPMLAESMGHGLGMRVYELPWIAPKEESLALDMRLEPGMVISLEPESWRGGRFVRLEDMILVTDSGNEVLTKTPYLTEYLR